MSSVAENQLPGTPNWELTRPALGQQIEGYMTAPSVNVGGSIGFCVNRGGLTPITNANAFHVDVYRMGWYGGAGARLVHRSPRGLPLVRQPLPRTYVTNRQPVDWQDLHNLIGANNNPHILIDCNWGISYTLDIPLEWPAAAGIEQSRVASGVYLGKLETEPTDASAPWQAWTIFTIREDNKPSDVLYQSSSMGWQAYNSWPADSSTGVHGNGIYAIGLSGFRRRVTYNRPYGQAWTTGNVGANHAIGTGEFFCPYNITGSPSGWEYNLLRWIERNDYDVTYCDNMDVHQNRRQLFGHKLFVSHGHDEYWTWQMYENIEHGADVGGCSLAFFGANVCYGCVRMDPDPETGQGDRIMAGYRLGGAGLMPLVPTDPDQWRVAATGTYLGPAYYLYVDPMALAKGRDALPFSFRRKYLQHNPATDATMQSGVAGPVTTGNRFRNEASLLGVLYFAENPGMDAPMLMTADAVGHRLLRPRPDKVPGYTGVSNGQNVGNFVGYEADLWAQSGTGPLDVFSPNRPTDTPPGNLVMLSASPLGPFTPNDQPLRANGTPVGCDHNTSTCPSHAVSYQRPSGAHVFASGTVQWAWGLDNYNASGGPGPGASRSARESPIIRTWTHNIFDDAIAR